MGSVFVFFQANNFCFPSHHPRSLPSSQYNSRLARDTAFCHVPQLTPVWCQRLHELSRTPGFPRIASKVSVWPTSGQKEEKRAVPGALGKMFPFPSEPTWELAGSFPPKPGPWGWVGGCESFRPPAEKGPVQRRAQHGDSQGNGESCQPQPGLQAPHPHHPARLWNCKRLIFCV